MDPYAASQFSLNFVDNDDDIGMSQANMMSNLITQQDNAYANDLFLTNYSQPAAPTALDLETELHFHDDEDIAEQLNLPPHACRYCGICDPAVVV